MGLGAHGLADARPNERYRIEDPVQGAEACEATESQPAVLHETKSPRTIGQRRPEARRSPDLPRLFDRVHYQDKI